MKVINNRRFLPGEGPRRGLLHDYEPSCGPLFEALIVTVTLVTLCHVQISQYWRGKHRIKSKMEIDPATQGDAGIYECHANNKSVIHLISKLINLLSCLVDRNGIVWEGEYLQRNIMTYFFSACPHLLSFQILHRHAILPDRLQHLCVLVRALLGILRRWKSHVSALAQLSAYRLCLPQVLTRRRQ